YEERIEKGRTFFLPNAPRDSRTFATATGRAMFTANALWYPRIPEGRVLLQTLRSHDQFNTTIYGKDDRYRGIHGGRRVVLAHPDDIREQGFADGDVVDLVSEWEGPHGLEERRAEAFRLVAYDTPRRNAAAYYPETNVPVPLESYAEISGTPAAQSIVVRFERRAWDGTDHDSPPRHADRPRRRAAQAPRRARGRGAARDPRRGRGRVGHDAHAGARRRARDGLPAVGGHDRRRRRRRGRDPLRRSRDGRPGEHLQRARPDPRAGRAAPRRLARPARIHDELVRRVRHGVDRSGAARVGVRRRGRPGRGRRRAARGPAW